MFAKPVPEKSDGQVLAALSTAAGQHLTAVLRSHALQKAMNAAALTLLRLEVCFISYSLLQVSPILGIFGDLRLANARRYRGSLADLIIAQGGKLSIANREKSTRRSKCQAAKELDFALCAGGPSGQIDANEPAVRCGFGGMLVQNLHFLPYFQLLLPISWKIVPYYNCIGGNLCYTISVSLCLKIGRAGFRACFPRVDTAVLADRERQHLPRSRRLCMLRPPAQEF